MSDADSSRKAFDNAMEIITEDYKQLPDGDKLISQITHKFTQLYNDPHVNELKKVVGDVNVDDARSLLFNPTLLQTRMYPLLLQKDNKLAPNFRLTILSLVYTLHRKKWTFLRDFILANGLNILVSMLTESNLYARGQVCEIILTAIDSDQEQFDWFVPFDESKDCGSVRGHLYRKLVDVYTESFLDNLIKNSCNYSRGKAENTFPGGSARCLQIMAFWLSWIRVQFTPDQKLQLSEALLTHLKEWSEIAAEQAKKEKEEDPGYKKPTDSECEKEDEENGEAKLAKTLVDDFGAAGEASINMMETNCGEFSDYYISLVSFSEKFLAINRYLSLDDHLTLVENNSVKFSYVSAKDGHVAESEILPPAVSKSTSSLSTINPQQLKDMGNDNFFAGKYFVALGFYSIGIRKLLDENHMDNTTQVKSLLASLYYNCASCYWKLAASAPESYPKLLQQYTDSGALKKYASTETLEALECEMRKNCLDMGMLYDACIDFCRKCNTMMPSHRRSLHRHASCLHALKQYNQALELIENGLSQIPSPENIAMQNQGRSKRNKQEVDNAMEETKALHDLRRLCMAHMLLTEGQPDGEDNDDNSLNKKPSTSNLVKDDVGNVLSKLRARHTREVNNITHAWDGVDRSNWGDEDLDSMKSPMELSEPNTTVDDNDKSRTATILESLSISGDTVDINAMVKSKASKKLKKQESKKKAEEDTKAIFKKCLKHNKQIRSIATYFITPEKRKQEVMDDGSPEYKDWMVSFCKNLKSIWKGGYTLHQIFEVKSLDEDMLFAFTVLFMDESGGVPTATKDKALLQLQECTGFQMIANFFFADDSMNLKGKDEWRIKYLS